MPFNIRGQGGALRSLTSSTDSPEVNTRGEQIVIPWEQAMVQAGRMFHVSNAARETALAVGGTSFSDTAPAFVFDVPEGITAYPVRLILNQGGTVAGGVITVLITADSGLRIGTSGTSHTIRNMRDDANRASSCSFDSGTTADANTLDVTYWGAILDQQVGAAVTAGPNTRVNWPEPGDVAPILYGPASLLIYAFATGTQPSWFFSFKWVEFGTESL